MAVCVYTWAPRTGDQLKLPPGYPELALERPEPDLERLDLERPEPDLAELTTLYAPKPPRGLAGPLPTICDALFLARILFPLALAIRFVIDFLLNSFFTP
jgi:hypothetical protein